MKRILLPVAMAMAATGCSRSIDSQFVDMCNDLKAHEPEKAAEMKTVCANPSIISSAQKADVVKAYNEFVKAREALEADQAK